MMMVMTMKMAAISTHEGEPHAPAHEGRMMIPRTAEQERKNEEDCDEPQHDDSSFRFLAEQGEQKDLRPPEWTQVLPSRSDRAHRAG